MEKAKVLQRLIEENGYSVNKVAKLAGIPQSTLATMLKNGVGKAGVDGVSNVCNVLGITLDDLIRLSRGETIYNREPVIQNEQAHLKKYRLLSDQGKQAIDNTIDAMLVAGTAQQAPEAANECRKKGARACDCETHANDRALHNRIDIQIIAPDGSVFGYDTISRDLFLQLKEKGAVTDYVDDIDRVVLPDELLQVAEPTAADIQRMLQDYLKKD